MHRGGELAHGVCTLAAEGAAAGDEGGVAGPPPIWGWGDMRPSRRPHVSCRGGCIARLLLLLLLMHLRCVLCNAARARIRIRRVIIISSSSIIIMSSSSSMTTRVLVTVVVIIAACGGA